MELCIKNMISLLIKVSSKENLCQKWSSYLNCIQLIRNTREISSRNGTSDKESFMIEFGHLILQCIKQKALIRECGPLNYQKLTHIHQDWSITHITCSQVIITIHLSVMMFQKEDSLILTSITWLSQCLHNYMMVWLNTMMEYHQVHLKWLMTFLSI